MLNMNLPWGGYVSRVIIQTANYLNFDGTYSAGGRQRHIRDLATVIRDEWKREVLIVQKGYSSFSTTCEHGFSVLGIKADCSAFGDPMFSHRVRRQVKDGDGVVYASGEDAWPFFHPTAKAIQHGVWWDGPQSSFTRFVQRKRALACMSSVRSVLCVDTNFINWLRCQGRIGLDLCTKCVYVPNYTDLSKLLISNEPKQLPLNLICARRYEEKRGTNLFIDAMGLLKRRGFAFEAHISTVGGLDEIRSRLKRCGIEDEVSVSEDDMDEVLKRYGSADLAVVPTVWSEGTSLAAVEAICAGVPVIGTPVGGLGNLIIPGFNGYLVTPTPETIADAIVRCGDLASLARMRANCLSMRDALGHASWTSRVLDWLDG